MESEVWAHESKLSWVFGIKDQHVKSFDHGWTALKNGGCISEFLFQV